MASAGDAVLRGATEDKSPNDDIHNLPPPSRAGSDRSSNDDRPDIPGIKKISRKRRTGTFRPALHQSWEVKGRTPYHEYVHRLVEAGWDNLKDLDAYMAKDYEDVELVVSVVDFVQGQGMRRGEDLTDVASLETFLKLDNREGVQVRLYLAEQAGEMSSAVMEAFGSNLRLDPRFFQWNISGSKNLLSPADRHRAPFTSIGFTVLDPSTAKMTDTSFFRNTIYIQPDEHGEGWTGVLLFNSHLKTNLTINTVLTPPTFTAADYSGIPPPVKRNPKTFRELYLDALPSLEPDEVAMSPFYAVHHLFRLNRRCWSDVISAIRDEDRRINGISEASVSHIEDIRRTFDVVKRGGTLGWARCLTPITVESKANIEEDFTHLLKQADFLWDSREKMAAVRRRRSEARWNALTNSFTFVFVPITVISGIYGMNVYEINGSAPDIWQFFVATAVIDVLIVLALALSNWIHIVSKQQRKAGVREVFSFALGRHST